jgi:hypothetical protein
LGGFAGRAGFVRAALCGLLRGLLCRHRFRVALGRAVIRVLPRGPAERPSGWLSYGSPSDGPKRPEHKSRLVCSSLTSEACDAQLGIGVGTSQRLSGTRD